MNRALMARRLTRLSAMGAAMLRVLTLATLFPNGAQPDLRRVRRAADAGARRAAPTSRSRWWRRSGCRSGRCRSIRIMRRCAALPRARDLERPHRPPPALTGSGRGSAQAGDGAADGATRCCRCCAEIRARFPFDVIDAEFFWPDGPAAMRLAAGARRALLDQGARQRHPFLGQRSPASRAQIVAAGRAADGLLAVSAALKARHGGARPAGGEDPRPPYRHRPRPLPARSTARRPRRRSASTGRCSSPPAHLHRAQGAGARARGAGAAARRDPDPGRRRARTARGSSEWRAGWASRGRVRFLGARPHDELPGLLAAADVMVLPTVSEGLANVWVEALACGTPVVTSDVGGAREVIDRPAAGRLVAARSRSDRRGGARDARRSARPGGGARGGGEVQLGAERRRAVRPSFGAGPLERHQRRGDPAALAAQQAPGAGGGAAVHRLDADPARLERGDEGARREGHGARRCRGAGIRARDRAPSSGSTCGRLERGERRRVPRRRPLRGQQHAFVDARRRSGSRARQSPGRAARRRRASRSNLGAVIAFVAPAAARRG